MNSMERLIEYLRLDPKNTQIPSLITEIESIQVVDLQSDVTLLKGVWELR